VYRTEDRSRPPRMVRVLDQRAGAFDDETANEFTKIAETHRRIFDEREDFRFVALTPGRRIPLNDGCGQAVHHAGRSNLERYPRRWS
jgi:hypothetical protein